MTKTYNLVTLYYKGHSPLKKKDNSYLMCLYTMLFVLFAMVIILLLCTVYNFDPTENEDIRIYNTPQPLKKIVASTTTTSTPTTVQNQLNYYFEETPEPIVNWDKVVDFFIGTEETNEENGNAPIEKHTETDGGVPSNTAAAQLASNSSSEEVSQINKKDFNESINVSKVPREHYNEGHKFEAENSFSVTPTTKIKDTGNKSTKNYESPLYNNLIQTESTKKSQLILMDATTPTVKENFFEWPEAIEEVETPPPSSPQNEEVEWVPKFQNLRIGNKTARFEVQKDCESARCKMAASSMLSSINLSIEPCHDFYSFACGGASRGKRYEPDLFSGKSTPKFDFVKKFNCFYKSCLYHEIHFNYRDRIRSTKQMLGNIGMFSFYQRKNNIDLTDVFASLVFLEAMPLFNIDIDVMNSTFIIKILPPDKSLTSKYWSPLKEIRRNCLRITQPENYQSPIDITFLYYDYEECQRNNDYLKSLETAMEELGNFGNMSNIQREMYIEDTLEIVQKDLLSILDEILPVPDIQESVVNLDYTLMNVRELENQFPLIHWQEFFKQVNSGEIETASSVQMYHKEYFLMLFERLSSLETDRLIRGFTAVLFEKYYQEVVLPTPRESRSKFCRVMSRKFFPDISNYLYRRTSINEEFNERKTYLVDVFKSMQRNYKDLLSSLDWLDDASRNSMMNKVKNLKIDTASNDLTRETIYLSELYNELYLKREDFSFNYHAAVYYRRKRFFSLHGKPVENENIFRNFVDHFKEEPVFFYGHNVVCLPDSLVSKTYLDLPRYLTIAKIGFPLAKVIGHTLDPIGIKFGIQLSRNVSSLYKKFVRESKKTLPHHSNFNNLDVVFNLNSRLSEAQRIAENCGMVLLTNSMEEIQHQALLPLASFTFSREKIFFMAMVQEFCKDMSLMEFVIQAHESSVLPPQFQVLNILQNSDVFNGQFSCRPVTKIPHLQFPHLSVLLQRNSDKIT
ncbi:neprilysin-2-like [Coccinella septempunctata]|uniref:neprilysin-2-like n=1 Tax=Coccinella septempunctata TaxID=41139 RepID=UPI001D096687|nr:neprilysin-2-like [Coccinella septempunctata]